MKVLENMLNILFPKYSTCIICGEDLATESKNNTCIKCEKNLPFINGNYCLICGEPLNDEGNVCVKCKGNKKKRPFLIARSCFIFKDDIARLIHAYKYENARYLAEPFSFYLERLYKTMDFSADFIVPIPLSDKKKKSRGYNQAELLCNSLGQFLNIKVDSSNLIRKQETISQTKLDYKQRQENLKTAFDIKSPKVFKNKNILLVDDVYTTGATTYNACLMLKKAGASNIVILTVAHTILKNEK